MSLVFLRSIGDLDDYSCTSGTPTVNSSYLTSDIMVEFTTSSVDKGFIEIRGAVMSYKGVAVCTTSTCFISEYIVSFKGYYSGSARQRYITSALRNVREVSWRLISRSNPATDYPSDFSLIQVCLSLCRPSFCSMRCPDRRNLL